MKVTQQTVQCGQSIVIVTDQEVHIVKAEPVEARPGAGVPEPVPIYGSLQMVAVAGSDQLLAQLGERISLEPRRHPAEWGDVEDLTLLLVADD